MKAGKVEPKGKSGFGSIFEKWNLPYFIVLMPIAAGVLGLAP